MYDHVRRRHALLRIVRLGRSIVHARGLLLYHAPTALQSARLEDVVSRPRAHSRMPHCVLVFACAARA